MAVKELKWEKDLRHHRKADHLGADFEIAEWVALFSFEKA
jgi:hypothetical protein